MKIFLIRHGESVGNTKQGYISGQSDPNGLTEKGRMQIVRTAFNIHHEVVDEIFSSDVARANETAKILSLYAQKDIKYLDFLKEINHGIFEGRYWWEVIHKIPLTWASRREDFKTPYPDGESMATVFKRVSDGLKSILNELDESKSYVFVSHQAILSIIRYILNFEDYGDTILHNKEQEFLAYLHKTKFDNGEVVKFVGRDKRSLKEVDLSLVTEIKPHKKEVEFYSRYFLSFKENDVIEKVHTASFNEVYEVKKKDKDVLIKIINPQANNTFKQQIDVYSFLNKYSIKAPKILKIDTSGIFFNGNVLVQDYVEGDKLTSCFSENEKNLKTFFKNLYQEISKIHALESWKLSSFWVPPVEPELTDWKNFMKCNINISIHKVQDMLKESRAYNLVLEELELLKDYVREERYKVVPLHGDLSTENIIISKYRPVEVLRFIDFEFVRLGDPLWDLAYLWGFIERKSLSASKIWFETLTSYLPEQKAQLLWYRTLFHVWSARDMIDYKDEETRVYRGKKSLELIRKFPSSCFI